jgi:hypothetical protein
MNSRLAHLLVRLYPRAWRERYGAEFEALLETGRADIRTLANVVWSALHERVIPTQPGTMDQHARSSRFQTWCMRAPWATFGLLPLVVLAGAYFIACLILLSGWEIFLPGTNTPFVRISGFAIFYFGVGRMLYFGGPILIGWAVALIATRQKTNAVWPVVGLALIALLSTGAQVQATRRVPTSAGHVSMHFDLGHSVQDVSSGLLHALIIFTLMALPYVIWRARNARSLSA